MTGKFEPKKTKGLPPPVKGRLKSGGITESELSGGQRVAAWTIADLSDLYKENWRDLRNYAQRCSGDANLAEDMLQDCFISVLLAGPELTSKEHALSYLRRAILNRSIDARRIQGRKPQLVVLDESSASETPNLLGDNQLEASQLLSAAEDAAVIRQALSLLSAAERASLVMWEVDGRSAEEIARELGINTSAVKHTLARARRSLRLILSTYIVDKENNVTAMDFLLNRRSFAKEFLREHNAKVIAVILLVSGISFWNYNNFSSAEMAKSVAEVKLFDMLDSQSETLVKESESVEISYKQVGDIELAASAKNADAIFPLDLGFDFKQSESQFIHLDNQGVKSDLKFYERKQLPYLESSVVTNIFKSGDATGGFLIVQRFDLNSNEQSEVDVSLAFSRDGFWVPYATQLTSSKLQLLPSGDFGIFAKFRVLGAIQSGMSIPSEPETFNMLEKPKFVEIFAIYESSSSRISRQLVKFGGVGPW